MTQNSDINRHDFKLQESIMKILAYYIIFGSITRKIAKKTKMVPIKVLTRNLIQSNNES